MKPMPTDAEAARVSCRCLTASGAPLVRGANVKTTAQTVGLRINGDGDLILSQDGGRGEMTIRPRSRPTPTTAR